MNSAVIGIDIGLSGAIGMLATDGTKRVVDLPTCPDGKSRRINGRDLIVTLRSLVPAGTLCLVVYEDVRARPAGNSSKHGNSMHSQASMVGSRRAIEAILDITGWRRRAIQPQTWKKHFGLIGKEKNDAREIAMKLFPSLAADLKRVKDHNRAEALLMAQFGIARHL